MDIVLVYNTLAEYEAETHYFGALIGRYGNRIAEGKFKLDGQEYSLAANNGVNHLHDGLKAFDKVAWDPKTILSESIVSLELSYLSKDMEEEYPGNLTADFNQDTLDHEIVINVDSFLPVDNTLIPTGEFRKINQKQFLDW